MISKVAGYIYGVSITNASYKNFGNSHLLSLIGTTWINLNNELFKYLAEFFKHLVELLKSSAECLKTSTRLYFVIKRVYKNLVCKKPHIFIGA